MAKSWQWSSGVLRPTPWCGKRGEWRMADLVSEYGPTPVRPASTVASTPAELIETTAELSDEGWGS